MVRYTIRKEKDSKGKFKHYTISKNGKGFQLEKTKKRAKEVVKQFKRSR